MNTSVKRRNPLMLFVALLSMTLLVSCSGNGPESVAEKFLELTNKGDFKNAKKYCDESTAALIGMAEKMAKDKVEDMKEKDVKIEILSSEISEEGDKAKVTYKSIEEGQTAEDSPEKQLDLVMVDGDWKVTIDKENLKKEN
ncbi:MAG: hypothetical protein BM557_00865 [Flavobacterium sp. MedPE-SWcel]|uniref:DUF4878 domain-containing protein n=1 Tax=uncultured Flavobacterium sp. TaxID=165435 RepID=UPI000919B0FD|nr:DUF4878 domain-containing protein [uncultured Flavobacterium sp.]OIQ22570.1 MAG: hypothetical protein BM557_00865 [Flavobacterium sp. MedPE-SWcel]